MWGEEEAIAGTGVDGEGEGKGMVGSEGSRGDGYGLLREVEKVTETGGDGGGWGKEVRGKRGGAGDGRGGSRGPVGVEGPSFEGKRGWVWVRRPR